MPSKATTSCWTTPRWKSRREAPEYSAAGFPAAGYREVFLTSNNIVPPIHITTQPVGNTTLLTGNALTMTVGIVGGEATFTYLWEDAHYFGDKNHTVNYGLVEIADGPMGSAFEGISGSATNALSSNSG